MAWCPPGEFPFDTCEIVYLVWKGVGSVWVGFPPLWGASLGQPTLGL